MLGLFGFPATVLAVGLVFTSLVAWQLRRTIDGQDAERFASAVDRLHDSIQVRLDTYIAMLRAGAGLLAATDATLPTPPQFAAFVRRLELQSRYPGIQGIGYTMRIPASRLAGVTARLQPFHPGFRVWPDTSRDEYHAILFLEPMDVRNRAAVGYDMFTDATRREAMERARDSGEAAASGRVTLIQEIDEEKQPGFLIYVPVFAGGGIPETLAERRQRLLGFVYSPFRAGDLFTGILGRDTRPRASFALFDGSPSGGRLLYGAEPRDPARFTAERLIDIAGRQWTARIFATPALDQSSHRVLVPFVFWGGVLATFVLTALASLQTAARRRAEASERRAEDASRKFEQLANSIPQLAWMARPDGWIYWYNDRWYEYTGTTPQQMEGWGWSAVHDPQELPRVLECFRQSLASGQPFHMEFPLKGADGQYRLFLTRMVPVRDGSGRIVHWLGTNTDVQYRHDAERSLQEQSNVNQRLYGEVQQALDRERAARADAERGSRLKDEFLATLSHELRTPLNAIVGWAHILKNTSLPEDKRRHALDVMLRNAGVQAHLIEDLLDMSRIISGRVSVELAPVDLRDVVSAAVNVVRPTAVAKNVSLTLDTEEAAVMVMGDASRLQQVFWNLLTNAVKFTPPGGTVAVRTRSAAAHVDVEIADTGIGIAPDFLPHVFERFRQADASSTRGHGGLGLGLSIVRSLVEMHGGSAEARSAGLQQGSTFVVRLPLAPSGASVRTA